MGAWTAIGLFVWAVRPYLRLTGPLWAWSGILHLNENFLNATPGSQFLVTEALLLIGLRNRAGALDPRVPHRAGLSTARGDLLAVLYAFLIPWNFPYLLVYPGSYLYPGDLPFDITTFNRVNVAVWLAPAVVIGIAFFADRLRSLSPAARRSVAPLMIAALIQAPPSLFAVASDLWGSDIVWSLEQDAVVFVANLAFGVIGLTGLFLVRRARGNVGDIVVELNRVEPGQVREALARAVGDPTLEVGLWLPDRDAWVDEQGEPLHLPPGEGRHATYIGDRLAVVVHELDLVDQPAIVEAAGSRRAARARERAPPRRAARPARRAARVARADRPAGDEERRRLERDLHDGAQQRLSRSAALSSSRPSDRPGAPRTSCSPSERGASEALASCASSRAASTRRC